MTKPTKKPKAANYATWLSAKKKKQPSAVDKIIRKRRQEREALSDEQVKESIKLTEAEIAALNQIASGRPMRNPAVVLQAIKLKLEYSVQKPAQKVDNDQKVQIEIITLPPEPKLDRLAVGETDKPTVCVVEPASEGPLLLGPTTIEEAADAE